MADTIPLVRALGGWGLALVLALAWRPLGPAALSVAVYVAGAALAWRLQDRLGPRLGVANVITLGRLAMVAWLAGAWSADWRIIVGVGAAVGIIDLVDGRLARRLGQTSGFGAVMDGEVDALLTLVLAVTVFVRHGAHAHVLVIGAMRYLMLAAQRLWPRLRGQVPSSPMAKWIFAAQVGALCYALAPFTGAHDLVVAGALVLLCVSFGRDVVYLLRAPGRA